MKYVRIKGLCPVRGVHIGCSEQILLAHSSNRSEHNEVGRGDTQKVSSYPGHQGVGVLDALDIRQQLPLGCHPPCK